MLEAVVQLGQECVDKNEFFRIKFRNVTTATMSTSPVEASLAKAMSGLIEQLEEKDAEITRLRAKIESLEKRNEERNEELEKETWQKGALYEQERVMREPEEVGFSNNGPFRAEAAAAAAGGGSLPQRSMTTGISRETEAVPRWVYGSFSPDDTGEDDGAAAAAAAGGGPSAPRTKSSHGVTANGAWIVKEIPALYPSYNCSAGPYVYWRKLPDGSGYIWDPKPAYSDDSDKEE